MPIFAIVIIISIQYQAMTENPFVLNGYLGDKYFCDREEQTEQLIGMIRNGNNIVISAPRRIGKSDFISHVFSQSEIKEKYITINVDIYAAQSMTDFVDYFGKAIVKALRSRGRAVIEGFVSILKSLQPQMSFDINGMPSWGLGINSSYRPETTLDEIFEYLEKSDKPCIVAIDEFQQITRFPDAWRIEALLRTYIQKCTNARFIFCGSHRHLMAEIFTSPNRPFYASVAFMSLPKLEVSVYEDFCSRLFKEYSKEIEKEAILEVYNITNGVTAYMQRILNMLFSMTPQHETCTKHKISQAIDNVLRNNEDMYITIYNMLSTRQRQLLHAISKEGIATKIQSAQFINKYNLGTASIVSSAIKTLLDKDLLTHDAQGYQVYDMFFNLWLKRQE